MRILLPCSGALVAVVTLVVACDTVDPSECWPNTSGGFGGSGTIPIGNGVGVGSGDFASPRVGPLGYGAPANPCVSNGGDTMKPGPAGGTSSSGGTGTPPCNQVLIGPPVTPGMGGSGAGGSGAGGSGAGGAAASALDGGDTGDPNPADAVSQTCMDGSELSTYIRCRGLTAAACEEACLNVGAYCNALVSHPYGSMGGIGRLKQCQSNTLNYTCTYCFIDNGDVCTRTKLKGFPQFWLCSYTGGKGCD
jgi:hypothetical protein